ncbi:MAG: LysR family transcriptional regulator [Eggerthellaceae bacterium]|jgi:DNA-binding transcriptional LysR family regulator|nr:LysR family transcriptional regulator [Eggerthellaceae bacterium]MCH4220722.1 LysR family transcriptional regulator [Eggerthellaceae bacterium]
MITIEIRQLEYLTRAAHYGSFSRAAESLFVSQQALSKSIRSLERSIDIPLFVRTHKGVCLTQFGESFIDKASIALHDIEALKKLSIEYHQGVRGILSLGVHTLCFKKNGGSIRTDHLLKFQDKHQDTQCTFIEAGDGELADAVLNGSLDFAISMAPENGVTNKVIDTVQIAVLVSQNSPISPDQSVISLQELAQGRLAMMYGEHAFDRLLDHAFTDNGLRTPHLPLRPQTNSTMIELAHKHHIYVLQPLAQARKVIKDTPMRALPIIDSKGRPLVIPLSIYWREGRMLSNAESDLVDYFYDIYNVQKDPLSHHIKAAG